MNEIKKVFRWFWVWDFEKEERWLNEMAAQGWALKKAGYARRYCFERTEPGEYIIRLEMREHDPAYMSFMEGLGAESVGRMFKWLYFRRKAEEGSFDLFSDLDSKIQHLNRIDRMLFLIGMGNLLIGIVNSISAAHIGWINLLCATLLMYGLGRIRGMKESLKLERELHE